MPRQSLAAKQNNFSKGLLTEFTGLNYPEDACTETFNCIFERIGKVRRRLGFENDASILTNNVDHQGKAITTFQWRNPNGDGTVIFEVKQIGKILYFYDVSTPAKVADVAPNIQPGQIDISFALAEGSVSDPSTTACEFASGYGYLFVFHPLCDPFYVESLGVGSFQANKITIEIRDFKGITDPAFETLTDDQRSSGLSPSHAYNLANQGWTSSWQIASSSLNAFEGGTHQFLVSTDAALVPKIVPGTFVRISYTGDFTNFMKGTITAYTGNNMFVNVSEFTNPTAPPAVDSWFISDDPDNIHIGWPQAFANLPSNSDIWWRYKDQDGIFNPKATFENITKPTRPAPRGHFVLKAFNKQRRIAASITGVPFPNDEVVFVRPPTGTFYAGRVWYAGVAHPEFSNTIFFSQIIENRNVNQLGKCYQVNDPTDEDLFDILPSDGGNVAVQNADIIYKLWPTQNALFIFAGNGVWAVTGSQGIGFTANDFSIQKISDVPTISSYNFVGVNGLPIWWNLNGIYTLSPGQNGYEVKSLTATNIDTYFNTFPANSKKYARGAYNKSTYIIQWLVRSTAETSVTDRYEYDTILNYNTVTQAFYPWTISAGVTGAPLKVHDICMIDTEGSPLATTQQGIDPVFKYLFSWRVGTGFSQFMFAEEKAKNHTDWKGIDSFVNGVGTGTTYSSYFISGYRTHGNYITKLQNTYVLLYNEVPEAISYSIQGIWDYAKSGNSGRFSAKEIRDLMPSNYSIRMARHKIRGQGYSLQYKVASVGTKPFYIIGWGAPESVAQST